MNTQDHNSDFPCDDEISILKQDITQLRHLLIAILERCDGVHGTVDGSSGANNMIYFKNIAIPCSLLRDPLQSNP
jgi:hypothetical protein